WEGRGLGGGGGVCCPPLSAVAPPSPVFPPARAAAPTPGVVVTNPAPGACQVAAHVPAASIVGLHPVRAGVRRTGPITIVPTVVMSLRIPVALNPDELRTRSWSHVVRGRRWRRLNHDSRGFLDHDRTTDRDAHR